MTFYEMNQPAARKFTIFDGILSKLSTGMKTVQYGRMLEALSGLTDEQLEAINLTRKDIPAHAHYCIYGD